jgi:hypothetical protein
MGKKKKNRLQMQKPRKFDEEFSQLFGGEGEIPLTPDVIKELVAKGWSEDDLNYAASSGAMYSTVRKSILFPPEMG